MLIDGLQCGHFTRETFADLRAADVGCVTVTCGFWEDAVESLDSLARWRDLIAANADWWRPRAPRPTSAPSSPRAAPPC